MFFDFLRKRKEPIVAEVLKDCALCFEYSKLVVEMEEEIGKLEEENMRLRLVKATLYTMLEGNDDDWICDGGSF